MSIRAFLNHHPQIEEGVYIDPDASVIGQVHLSTGVSVWPRAVLRGDVNTIKVGARSNIQDLAMLHCTHDGPYTPDGHPLAIGADVTIGHHACLHGCTLEDRVLVGMGAIILDGAYVESNVIIAAGALVPPGKRLQAGHLYVGSPVKQSRALSEAEIAQLQYSAAHYVRLANAHQRDGSI
jgi:carbonic anhydrase/acetyltransferase-like protein (isoleucine patch superfamily)